MDLSTYQAYWPGSEFLGSVLMSPATVRGTDPTWWVNTVSQSAPGVGPGTYTLPRAGAVGITGPQSSPTIADCFSNCMAGPWGSLVGAGPACAALCSGAGAGVPGAGAISGAIGGLGSKFQHVGIDIAFAIVGVLLIVIAIIVLTSRGEIKLVRGE